MRIAFAVNLGDWFVNPEVEANTRAAVAALSDAGAVVAEVPIGLNRRDVELAMNIHFGAIFGSAVGQVDDEFGDMLTDYARSFAKMGRFHSGSGRFYEGLELEAAIYNKIGPLLDDYDALICPTSGVPALVAGENYLKPEDADGSWSDPIVDTIMTPVFNILSRCPVLSVPSGWASNEVPTGIQIVGRTYDDATVFRIGQALETVRPWDYYQGRQPRFIPAPR
jgi:aspartyl-tRNA(Asn)/glutamyl-tRNA(Gln) amidotransferase subunit A